MQGSLACVSGKPACAVCCLTLRMLKNSSLFLVSPLPGLVGILSDWLVETALDLADEVFTQLLLSPEQANTLGHSKPFFRAFENCRGTAIASGVTNHSPPNPVTYLQSFIYSPCLCVRALLFTGVFSGTQDSVFTNGAVCSKSPCVLIKKTCLVTRGDQVLQSRRL